MSAKGPLTGIDPKTGKPRTRAEYMALRRKWEAKLRAKGFYDIEGTNEHEAHTFLGTRGNVFTYSIEAVHKSMPSHSDLRQHELESYLPIDATEQDAAYLFYAARRQFLHSRAFLWRRQKWPLDTAIWSRHADGLPEREIAADLNIRRHRVTRTIERLTALMQAWWEETAAEREQERQQRAEDGENT